MQQQQEQEAANQERDVSYLRSLVYWCMLSEVLRTETSTGE